MIRHHSKPLLLILSVLLVPFLTPHQVFSQEDGKERVQQDPPNVKKDLRYGALTWMQQSAEYALLTEQNYRFATTQLNIGLHDPYWSADEVQLKEGGYEEKPAAVILDVDETVLENSFYNARNILAGNEYSTDTWNEWCLEEKAEAIPGALEFITAAEGLGVKIFYVTNRRDVVKDATIKNLNALGFKADENNVLTKNPEEGRGDDKISRRAMVAKDYRIVLLIGDSFSDLCSEVDTLNTKRRNEIAKAKQKMLGSRWIMIPNPAYGAWQRALPKAEKALILKRD